MATANPPYAVTRSGKPINANDAVTVVGSIVSITGSGVTASVVVQLAGSLTNVTVQAQDIAASGETL